MPKNNKRGFTLIEMLVAVLLLITAVAGPLTIASKGITTSVVAKDQVTAFFLAQDAIEYIRHKRDTNRLSGVDREDWLAGLDNCISSDGSRACIIQSTEHSSSVPTPCAAGETGCSIMRYDNNNNRFTNVATEGSLSPINMRRFVRIITPVSGNADEAAVVVRMTWFSAQNTTALREIVVRENMLNWQ